MSLLGQLTTTFVPPAPCATSSSNTYIDERTVLAVGPLRDQAQCFPENYVAFRDFFYSPGICPSGYSTACSSHNTVGTVTETVVTCCPSPYSCIPQAIFLEQASYGCASPTGISWTIGTLTELSSGKPVSVMSMTYTDPGGNAGAVHAFSVQVRFQSTDFTSTTSARSTKSATSTASGLSTTPPNTISGVGISAGSSGSLSTGAAVGVGVVSTLGALLIAGLIYFGYCYSKTKRRQPLGTAISEAREAEVQLQPMYQQKVELSAQQTWELPGSQLTWELPGSHSTRRD